MTAGFAMQTAVPPLDILEWRGWVYSIGGHKDALTVANYLRFYNPDLQGSPTWWSYPMTKGMDLNAAVSMAKVQALPEQVVYLKQQLLTKYADTISFENDWKLLTIFIGANNICVCCNNETSGQPAFFEKQLRLVLQEVTDTIPKVFVNIMTIFNISQVWDEGHTHDYCDFVEHHVNECPCLNDDRNGANLKAMDEHSRLFNAITYKVAAEFSALNNDTFTVVVQPAVENLEFVQYGEAFLSDLDCFHPSYHADVGIGVGLWNNMFAPPAEKKSNLHLKDMKIYCPTATDVIQ